ncbi:MAG TPA: TRAP transporter large permease [Thermoanaerobaculia bacterium]|nr:TRAP transporter large permease [Thermoanaerobaculia bacterium]
MGSEGAVLAVALVALLALGAPISVAIGVAAAVSLCAAIPAAPALATVAQQIATGLDSFALLAIPLFILSGHLMNRGGAARRLIDLGKELVGALPGGLVWVEVLGCVLFGAISGSAVATAAAVGGVMAPRMEQDGYGRDFGAALSVAAATTGLLIPPSNVLIVYSLASGGVSVAALFFAGYVPGLLIALLVGVTAVGLAARRGRLPRARGFAMGRLGKSAAAALPSLLLVVVVMGGIVAGIFTATEAAGIAVLYALVLALAVHRELRPRELPRVLVEAAATTGVVLLLIGASMALAWTMAYAGIPQAVARLLLDAAAGPVALLLALNLLLLAIGTFLDMTPAVLLFTPMFLPAAVELGIDPVHLGIVMTLNLCIGISTPPVGTLLFVACGVSGTTLGRVVPYLAPLYAALLLALAVVTAVPELSLALPRALGLLGD